MNISTNTEMTDYPIIRLPTSVGSSLIRAFGANFEILENQYRRMDPQNTPSKKRPRRGCSDDEGDGDGDDGQSSSATKMSSKTSLSPHQAQVIAAIANGLSVFVTGSAGTGKSFLLRHAISALRRIHPPNSVFVTASTGVAACALGGQTLHSFAGVGLGKERKGQLLSRACRSQKTVDRWRRVKALVIDEISMIDGELFDNLEYVSSAIRTPNGNGIKSWGGIQLVVSGDFFQLPPIRAPNPRKEFAFEAACWDTTFDVQMELTHIYRQSDSDLIEFLEGIRRGHVDHNNDNFQRFLHGTTTDDGSDVNDNETRLFPRKEDVIRLNQERLRSLGKEVVRFNAVDRGRDPWKAQLKHSIAPEELDICEGARVMLIKNTDQAIGLVNGATGVVTGFKESSISSSEISPTGVVPTVRFDSGLEVSLESEKWDIMEGNVVMAVRRQVPLILAWALSVHKCQGMTLDRLRTDLSRAFGCGMVYVALSRVTTIQGLRVSGFSPENIKAHPKVLNFYTKLLRRSSSGNSTDVQL